MRAPAEDPLPLQSCFLSFSSPALLLMYDLVVQMQTDTGTGKIRKRHTNIFSMYKERGDHYHFVARPWSNICFRVSLVPSALALSLSRTVLRGWSFRPMPSRQF